MAANHPIAVSVIGTGKVARQLGLALKKSGCRIIDLYGRNSITSKNLAKELGTKKINALAELSPDADLILIAVNDDSIASVSKNIPSSKSIVVHTSGSVTMNDLSSHLMNKGVLYPLQTFTSAGKVDLSAVPLLIEASNNNSLKLLKLISSKLSRNVHKVNSADRLWIHLCAVLVNNFTNHLFCTAEQLLKQKQKSFSLLAPLIKQTIINATTSSPCKSQTGPAKRGDIKTIRKHLDLLRPYPAYHKIYRSLSDAIRATNNTRKKPSHG